MFQCKIVTVAIVKSPRTIKFLGIIAAAKDRKITAKEGRERAMKEVRDFVEERFLAYSLREIGGRSRDEIVAEGSWGSPRRGLKSNKRMRRGRERERAREGKASRPRKSKFRHPLVIRRVPSHVGTPASPSPSSSPEGCVGTIGF